jgi:SEC-C motif-containing protein
VTQPCPCHSGQPYAHCCQPFHEGKQRPSPTQLMRARYAAYALGNVRFIRQTQRPEHGRTAQAQENASQRRAIQAFCQNTQFLGLQILADEILSESQATVTFHATLLQNGQDASFTEQSLFERYQGRWFYVRALAQE